MEAQWAVGLPSTTCSLLMRHSNESILWARARPCRTTRKKHFLPVLSSQSGGGGGEDPGRQTDRQVKYNALSLQWRGVKGPTAPQGHLGQQVLGAPSMRVCWNRAGGRVPE